MIEFLGLVSIIFSFGWIFWKNWVRLVRVLEELMLMMMVLRLWLVCV